jgi:branched-chain amino acid transport system permease protein
MFEAVVQSILNGLVAGTIMAVPAIGFSAMFGVLRFANFAIGAFATVGAYAGYLANRLLGWPIEPALGAAFAGAAMAGWVTDRLATRPLEKAGALPMAIASLAAGLVLENAVRGAFGNDLRGFDLPLMRDWFFGPYRIGPQQIANLGIALAIMAAIWAFLRFSRLGKSMRAVADNTDLARLKGIHPGRVATLATLVGAGLCGIGGMLIGLDSSIDPLTGTRVLLSVFAAAVLGGLGSIPGAVVGAMVIGVVEELTVLLLSPAYRLVVGFAVILVVLTFRPRGLLGDRTG